MNQNLKTVLVVVIFVTNFYLVNAQYEFPPLSPKAVITQQVGNTNVSVEYERPSVRNRKIYGGLVPYNQVWRTGAGYCTKISFDKPVVIGGQSVNPGTYSIFTIPNPDEWVVILNSDISLYGSHKYDAKKDVIRFIVKPTQSTRFYEAFTIDIDTFPNDAKVYISWGNTAISFELETTTNKVFMKYVHEYLLTQKEKEGHRYPNAAEHLNLMNVNFNLALELCDIVLEKYKNEEESSKGMAFRVKVEIYEKLHRYEEALKVLEEAVKNEKNPNEIPHWEVYKERIEGKIKC